MQRKRESALVKIWKETHSPPIWQRIQQLLQVNGKNHLFRTKTWSANGSFQKENPGELLKYIANDYDKISWSLESSNLQENQKWQNRLKRKTIMIS